MNKLVIGDKEYELPVNLTLDKWIELNKWQLSAERLISVAMGIPLDEVDVIPEETKQLAVALIIAIMNPDWTPVKTEVKGGTLVDFNTISLGKFIDLDIYLATYTKDIKEIVKVLYGIEDTDDLILSDVFSAIKSFIQWRILLYKQYSNLFNDGGDNEEVVEDNHIKINPAHSWMDITMTLADGNFLAMDEVLNKPVIQAFNWLAWNKDRIKKENELQRHNRQARNIS
jgi:hypothetical protein